MVMKQLSAALAFSARASVARMTSVAETCLARIMAASSAADVKARSAGVMAALGWWQAKTHKLPAVGRNSDSVLRRSAPPNGAIRLMPIAPYETHGMEKPHEML